MDSPRSTPGANACDLGDVVERFRPDTANLIAGVILGLLMIGGGVAGLGWMLYEANQVNWSMPFMTGRGERGMCWFALLLGGAVCVGLTIGGVVLILWCRSMFGHYVIVFRDGIQYHEKANDETVRWSDVTSVKHIVLHERAPLLKGPAKLLIPRQDSSIYHVSRNDGRTFIFTRNTVRNLERFGAILRDQVKQRKLLWEEAEEYIN